MRRYGIVLLILAMMLSLTACKAKGNETFDLESIDTQEEAKKMLDMGIDTILTNDYNLVSQVIK